MQKVSPCKGCETRSAGCHGSCEAYKNWKSERDEIKAAQTKQSTAEYRYRSYRQCVYDRNEKIRKTTMNQR